MVLGVESSTRSTKIEVRDADDGRIFGEGRAPHPPVHPPRSEQEPTAWWQALVEARHQAGGALGVAAIAVAAQTHGLVVLDHEHRVIRPAKLWNDTESTPDAAALVDALGGAEEWVHACGSVPGAAFEIAKLAWLKRCEPAAFEKVATVLLPHDWLTYRMSRRVVTDRGDASGTGYWSPRENRWRPELLGLVDEAKDWGACLPRVLGPDEPAGDREGVLIAAGTGDHMAAALGLGLRARDVVVSLGAVGTVFTVRERPTEDPTGAVVGLADATGRFLPLVTAVGGLELIEMFARVLGVDAARFDQLALNAPPGAGGLVLVPPREQGTHPVAGGLTGALTGIRDGVTPELVARAVVEGVVCSIIDGMRALRSADVPLGGRTFLLTNGTRSHAVARVLADLAERPVAVPQGERVATGACVQAAAAVHGTSADDVADAWGLDRAREVEPDPRVDAEEIRNAYRAARERAAHEA